MRATGLAAFGLFGVLAVSGPDRRAFLQGLVSNDVGKIGRDAARYAALLTAQGKYLHDFIMVEVGESIWLDAEAGRLADLKRRLSMYRLRSKVSLDDKPEFAVAAVFGEAALAALDLPGEPGTVRPTTPPTDPSREGLDQPTPSSPIRMNSAALSHLT